MTRDENGRFVKGNPGGGRKPRKTEEKYLQAFKSAVTLDDWTAIIKRAIGQAKQGDATARKFIADYIIGAPVVRLGDSEGGPLVVQVLKGVSMDEL